MKIKKVENKPMVVHTQRRTHIHLAATGARTTLDQMDGGEEVYESAMVASVAISPAISAVRTGRNIYRSFSHRKQAKKQMQKQAKKQTKKLAKKVTKNTAKKVAKKAAKETAKTTAKETTKVVAKTATTVATTAAGTAASPGIGTAIGFAAGYAAGVAVDYQDMKWTGRARKWKFFVDKMNPQEQQKDSFARLVKDLFFNRVKFIFRTILPLVAPIILSLVISIVSVVVPVLAVVALIYNSPFAIFFPSISSAETTQDVLSAYVAEFDRDVQAEVSQFSGYDRSEKIYLDFEGIGEPNNYCDILSVYMVKHGVGDTATDMTKTAKKNLKAVFDDMCSYSVGSRTDTETDENGNEKTISVKEVRVDLKTYSDMISVYGFDEEEKKVLEEIVHSEYWAQLGYASEGMMGEPIRPEQYQAILDGISDANGKKVVAFALSKVGYPYSQDKRDSGTHYDCSSLAYYAWKQTGVNLSYEGANTAAAEGKFCYDKKLLVEYEDMQPGDLIFYSYSSNGRFQNITHVAIYVGDGKVVEAVNESMGVVYRDVQSQGSIVFIGRPR